ncbi:MAG: PorT family protein [Prevotella sp.]|jgi:hypothetical protein|nr:PorT family protein [Prevotella sp.]
MKTIIKANLLVIFLLIGLAANAQRHFYYDYVKFRPKVTFNVEMGVSFSNLSGYPLDTKSKAGFVAGMSVDWQFAKNWYVDFGVMFQEKGAKFDQEYTDYNGYNLRSPNSTLDAMYIQIPIHFGYKYQISKMMDISFHAGPYIAYGVGGQMKLGDTVEKYGLDWSYIESKPIGEFINDSFAGFKRYADTFSDAYFKKLDYGLGLGVLFEYNNIGLGVNYDFGLTNISEVEANNVKNRAGYVTLGYRF